MLKPRRRSSVNGQAKAVIHALREECAPGSGCADRLTALAVNGTERSAALTNVPTTREAGFADAEYPIWLGMFVPAKTSHEIIDRLNRETIKALRQPKVSHKLAALGFEPMVMTPAEFEAHVQREVAVNAALVK